jgi:hypothetical protein
MRRRVLISLDGEVLGHVAPLVALHDHRRFVDQFSLRDAPIGTEVEDQCDV